MSNQTYIITHIPKTAGSSLRVHFQNNLEDQVEFIHLANKGHKKASNLNLNPFHLRPQIQKNQAKVIFGHQVNQTTKELINTNLIKEVVVFRDPLSWEVSRYNQYANNVTNNQNTQLEFNDWCNPNKVNKIHSQFDWFLENYAQTSVRNLDPKARNEILFKTLAHFDHVLFLEDFPHCLLEIFTDLSVPTTLEKSTNVVGLDKPNWYKENEENKNLLQIICDRDIDTYASLYSSFGLN